MRLALAASAGFLFGSALYAWLVYAGAVAQGHRAYTHVVLATTFLIAIEAIAVSSVKGPQTWLLLITNITGIAAMLSVAKRFL